MMAKNTLISDIIEDCEGLQEEHSLNADLQRLASEMVDELINQGVDSEESMMKVAECFFEECLLNHCANEDQMARYVEDWLDRFLAGVKNEGQHQIH